MDFSSDLLLEILLKLPVKSLIRFTVVCKSWHSLITSPAFISTHLAQQTPLPHTLLIRRDDDNYALFEDCKDRPFCLKFSSQLNLPFDSPFCLKFLSQLNFAFFDRVPHFDIVGSYNGMICLCDALFALPYLGISTSPIFWNPCIHKCTVLPFPTSSLQRVQRCVLGFGANNDNDDYKLVSLVYPMDYNEFFRDDVPPEVEIYSLSTGVWRRVIGVEIKHYIGGSKSEAFVNGNLHWLAFNVDEQNNFWNAVVSFNIADEVFGEIILPDALVGAYRTDLSIVALEGSLVVVKLWSQIDYFSAEVWVMKSYGVSESWTKLYCFNLVADVFRFVGFRSNGEVLVSTMNNELVSYDPNSGQHKRLGIGGDRYLFKVQNYRESLALLQGELNFLDGIGS